METESQQAVASCFFRGSSPFTVTLTSSNPSCPDCDAPYCTKHGEPLCLDCWLPWSAHYGSWKPLKEK